MPDDFVEAFVDKLLLLESETGARVHYRIMPPLNMRKNDVLSAQHAAREIAAFVGLTGYTFIVALIGQSEKVGGNIDLTTEGEAVFIEVDPAIGNFPQTAAASSCQNLWKLPGRSPQVASLTQPAAEPSGRPRT